MLIAKNASKLTRSITMKKVLKIRKVAGFAIEEHVYQMTSHPPVARYENRLSDTIQKWCVEPKVKVWFAERQKIE